VYNWGIEDRKNLWQYCHVSAGYYEQNAYLPLLKKEYPWLKNVHSHPLQEALRRVDRSFAAFFRRCEAGEIPGYPRFKSPKWYNSFTMKNWGNGASFDGKRLALSKVGRVRIVLHRPIHGTIKTCTIRRRADGWYALFSVECADTPLRINANPVGVDVGLTTFVALSTGELIANPRHLRTAEKALAKAQHVLSRRKCGSARRGKARQALAQQHLRLSRTRKDFHFKIAKSIADRFNPIVVEKLKIKNMMQNHHLAKSISDAAWGQFLGILSHKAEEAGAAYMAVEARGTSQACSGCGVIVPKTLAERTHKCGDCGLVLDRDVNAARNILKRGWAVPSGRVA
jgi:putative transposase